MVNQEKLDTLFQIVSTMEQSILNLETAFERGNDEKFESAKRTILQLQKKFSEELK